MTTLYEKFLIQEARDRAHLSVAEAAAWILRYAPSQTAKPRLWRGRLDAATADTCFIMDPSTSPRRAQNTSDIYRALLDYVNPNWPQRSESLICSTSKQLAAEYGTAYGVYVPDSDSFAAINSRDLWDTGIATIAETLTLLWESDVGFGAELSAWMREKLRPGFDADKSNIVTIADLNREMEEVRIRWHAQPEEDRLTIRNEISRWQRGESVYASAVFDWLNSGGEVKFADHWKSGSHSLKYSSLGATLHRTTDTVRGGASECWTSATCLLVHESLIWSVGQEIEDIEMLKRKTPVE